jgi:putative transposase
MPRKPRIEFPGAFYHVIARGNNRQSIFEDKRDFEEFLQSLAVARERFPYILHAYTLMTNHFHLLMETEDFPLSRIMRSVLTRYSRYFNRRHKRIGHLFAARYKAILCQKDTYLLELARYIHLNPVRAGLVKSPADWPWSSHKIYLGGVANPFVHTEEILSRFSHFDRRARKAYASFIREGLNLGHKKDLYPPETIPVLGSVSFVKRHTQRQGSDTSESPSRAVASLPDLAKGVARHFQLSPSVLSGTSRMRPIARARALFAFCAVQRGRHSMASVARFLHVHPSSITRSFRQAQTVATESPNLIKTLLRSVI